MRVVSVPTSRAWAGRQSLAALRHLPHDQYRHAQRGSLLLHPARIGQHDIGAAHQRDEVAVRQWRHEADAVDVAEHGAQRHRDLGVRVERQHDLSAAVRQLAQRGGDAAQRRAVILAPVHGDDDQSPRGIEAQVRSRSARRRQKRIDAAVAGDVDRCRSDPFGRQRAGGGSGRGEVDAGDLRDDAAVHLLRERLVAAAAQARLDMHDGDARISGGLRGGEGGGGVALHDDGSGRGGGDDRRQRRQRRCDDIRRGLPALHDVEVDLGRDAEFRQRIAQHLAVLPSRDDDGLQRLMRGESEDNRCQLDRLRACPDDAQDRCSRHSVAPRPRNEFYEQPDGWRQAPNAARAGSGGGDPLHPKHGEEPPLPRRRLGLYFPAPITGCHR